ncbi:MAG: biopolymer transporter ExbD [Planctomycetota bacterium]|nr:biopolymer transporter ExbD [Planctomycetota bacterium]
MRRSSYDRPARVELLPLLDVVFLLLAVLLFSMVTMVRSHVVPVDLPSLATGEARELAAVLVLSVEAGGQLSLAGEPIDTPALEAILRERRAAASDDLAVMVHADREARHGDVTRVFDVLRAAGQERVFLVGKPGEGER